MTNTDAFFTPPPTRDYHLADPSLEGDRLLTFPSALTTPHPANNTVYCRWFEARAARRAPRAAVVAAAVELGRRWTCGTLLGRWRGTVWARCA
jgi:hypothetical protein